MDVDQDVNQINQLNSSGWMLEIDPEIVVGQDVFSTGSDAHIWQALSSSEGRDISALLIVSRLSIAERKTCVPLI